MALCRTVVLTCVAAAATAHGQPPAPYSLPWQLRPTMPATLVRSDSSFVVATPSGGEAATLVSMLTVAYRVSKGLALAPLVRLGLVHHGGPSGSGTPSSTR